MTTLHWWFERTHPRRADESDYDHAVARYRYAVCCESDAWMAGADMAPYREELAASWAVVDAMNDAQRRIDRPWEGCMNGGAL